MMTKSTLPVNISYIQDIQGLTYQANTEYLVYELINPFIHICIKGIKIVQVDLLSTHL